MLQTSPSVLPRLRTGPLCATILACTLAWPAPIASPARAEPTASAHPQKAAPAKQSHALRVFDTDDRQPVGDTTRFPWSCVGVVEAVWYKADNLRLISTGTGTLIGERVVLTGGHCIYSQEDGWADEVVFIPGKNGSFEPFGRAASVRNIAQRAWVDDADNRYDLAMLVLDQPLGAQTGHMTVAAESTDFFVERNLNSSGYPGETKTGDVQYHSYGRSLDVQDGLIRHLVDSEPGQSGSGLWYYDPADQSRRLLGVLTGTREINSGGTVVDAYNVAIHINAGFAEWIEQTLTTYDGGVQDIAVSENNSSAGPAACGAGLPAAGLMMLVLCAGLRLTTTRRRRCPLPPASGRGTC